MISDRKSKILCTINFILCITTLIFLIVVSCFEFSINKKVFSASDIFNIAKNSVVELRAESKIYGNSFGSAVCIDETRLLTNAHVVGRTIEKDIELYEYISFRLYNSDEYFPVSVIDCDFEKDLCLLKLANKCKGLVPISIQNGNEVQSGDRVYAVGNAMNHGIGIVEGILSAPYININIKGNKMLVMQCDIVISSGSSGGALLDCFGRLIGLTTFRVKDQQGYIVYGVGFAIPTITIEKFLEQNVIETI